MAVEFATAALDRAAVSPGESPGNVDAPCVTVVAGAGSKPAWRAPVARRIVEPDGKIASTSGMRTMSTSRHGLGKSSIAAPVPSMITWNSEVAVAPSRSLAVTVSVVRPAARGRMSSSESCIRHSTTPSAEDETKKESRSPGASASVKYFERSMLLPAGSPLCK